MSILLDVDVARQASANSCWWACLRMMIRYYGRPPVSPEMLNDRFRRPPSMRPWDPTSYQAIARTPDVDDDNLLMPYEWFDFGVPMTVGALRILCELTGLAPLGDSVPRHQEWEAETFEANLRRFGPFIFIGNWNGQGFHAILVTGRIREQVGQNTEDRIYYNDPAYASTQYLTVAEFKERVRNIGLAGYSVLYLARMYGAEIQQRVRGTIEDSQD